MNEQNCRQSVMRLTNFREHSRLRHSQARVRQQFFQVENCCNLAVDDPRPSGVVSASRTHPSDAFIDDIHNPVDSQPQGAAAVLAYD